MLPFTREQFLAVLVAYNETVWPAPALAYLLGRLLVIPVIWSLIGGQAAFLLGMTQDWLLLVSGLTVLAWLWRDAARRRSENKRRNELRLSTGVRSVAP